MFRWLVRVEDPPVELRVIRTVIGTEIDAPAIAPAIAEMISDMCAVTNCISSHPFSDHLGERVLVDQAAYQWRRPTFWRRCKTA